MELNFESRKKLAQSVHEAFESGDPRFSVVYEAQRKPYTVVEVAFHDGLLQELNGLTGIGFSKVSYPDTFSKAGGRTIAINSALYDLIGKFFVQAYCKLNPDYVPAMA